MNLETAVLATEITEDTEKHEVFRSLFAHTKGDFKNRCNCLILLGDLCVLCGQMIFQDE